MTELPTAPPRPLYAEPAGVLPPPVAQQPAPELPPPTETPTSEPATPAQEEGRFAKGREGAKRWLSRASDDARQQLRRSWELASATVEGLRRHWQIPALSLLLTLVSWSIFVIIVACVPSTGAAGILLTFALTLVNQAVHMLADAALMLSLVRTRETAARPSLGEITKEVTTCPLVEQLGTLVRVSWAEGIVCAAVAIVRGVCDVIMLPFTLCMKEPWSLEKAPAVDVLMQMLLALVLVTQEGLTAKRAAETSEAYLETQVGPRARFFRTLGPLMAVSLLPILIIGIIVGACGFFAAGWSLVFLSVSVGQWMHNLTGHMLCLGHYRLAGACVHAPLGE